MEMELSEYIYYNFDRKKRNFKILIIYYYK